MTPAFTGLHKLALSETPLHNRYQSATARDLDQVPAALRKYLRELCAGQRKWPLFVHGPVGSGKSCAALCVADRLPHQRDRDLFWAMPSFVNHVWNVKKGRVDWYDCGRGGTLTEKGWWAGVANLPLLILDDVGLREANSDYQMEPLFLALEARAGKPLICTSNWDEEDIEKIYNERIRSRMCCGTIYELRGEDRRYDEPAELQSHVR